MSDLDTEQNRRIRDVESRINELENQVSAILAKLDVGSESMQRPVDSRWNSNRYRRSAYDEWRCLKCQEDSE